jgi:hypothetical protein
MKVASPRGSFQVTKVLRSLMNSLVASDISFLVRAIQEFTFALVQVYEMEILLFSRAE